MRPNNKKHSLITAKLFPSTFSLRDACGIAFFSLLLAASSLLLNSCNTTEPGRQPGITLNFEDASSTEVWMKLNTNGLDLPAEVSVYKNNKLNKNINLTSNDSVIYQDNLMPNKTYTFKATAKLGDLELQSKSITAVTMDTTSHNFTWQTYTFGGVNGSSILRDVAIINENDIWAVGEIHTAETDQYDSNGVWVQPYNAVHWDGNTWELKRISVNYRGQPNLAPLVAVFALKNGKVIFSSGLPYLPEGDHWKLYHLWDMGILDNNDGSLYSIWGTSMENLYFVGNKGTIAHYNGTSWEKIESGTDMNLLDIYGNYSSTIYISGGKASLLKGVLLGGDLDGFKILKRGESINANDMFNPYFAGNISTIWINPNNTVYFGGHLLYKYKLGIWEIVSSLDGNFMGGNSSAQHFGYITRIRGTSENNIFLVGERNTLRHFNGKTWEQIGMPYNVSSYIIWSSVAVRGKVITTVGSRGQKAMIMILKR